MLRKLGFAVITLGTVHTSQANAQRVSAPISDVSYEVTADSSAVGRRQLGVTMSFTVAGTAPVILALPAWSPGHYVLLWFARRVSAFSAQSNGAALDWKKLDYQTWEIIPRSPGTVRVSFNYLADAVDRAVAWTAPNFAFFNGTNLFLYPAGSPFVPSHRGGLRPEWILPACRIRSRQEIITISPTCRSTSGGLLSIARRSPASGFVSPGIQRRA